MFLVSEVDILLSLVSELIGIAFYYLICSECMGAEVVECGCVIGLPEVKVMFELI